MLFHRSQMQAMRHFSYPVIPASWPSRAIRRAVKQHRLHRLPTAWKAALAATPRIAEVIQSLP